MASQTEENFGTVFMFGLILCLVLGLIVYMIG